MRCWRNDDVGDWKFGAAACAAETAEEIMAEGTGVEAVFGAEAGLPVAVKCNGDTARVELGALEFPAPDAAEPDPPEPDPPEPDPPLTCCCSICSICVTSLSSLNCASCPTNWLGSMGSSGS